MFWQKFVEPMLAPFRAIRSKIWGVKTVTGRVTGDAKRVKQLGSSVKNKAGDAKGKVAGVKGKAAGMKDKAGAAKGKFADANAKAGAARGQAQGAGGGGGGGAAGGAGGGALNPNPGVKKVGFFRKKLICEQCGQQLDKSWDGCPYCAQAAASQASAAPAQKTMAFMIDGAGSMTGTQMLAWLVPIEGPQRGELYTLAPNSSIGTDPSCTVVLNDQYMSSHHAEIKAEGGVWVLKDLGSTNGTYVNDQRIDQQELVDNDFVKFGGQQVKFKSL
jgi:hypothetical protein